MGLSLHVFLIWNSYIAFIASRIAELHCFEITSTLYHAEDTLVVPGGNSLLQAGSVMHAPIIFSGVAAKGDHAACPKTT